MATREVLRYSIRASIEGNYSDYYSTILASEVYQLARVLKRMGFVLEITAEIEEVTVPEETPTDDTLGADWGNDSSNRANFGLG